MIETARGQAGADAVECLVADAQTYDFGAEIFDAVVSRFGLMFFPEPVAAFTNLAQATKPGGRLAAAVWQTRDRVPLFDIPYQAAAGVLEEFEIPYEATAADENQCSLGTRDRIVSTLEPAGWHDIATRPTEQTLYVGGPLTTEEAVEMALSVGPIRELLEGRSPAVVDAVRDRIRSQFGPRHDGIGVVVPGGFMIVTARR
jgi:SAM-dependent methyltransferase